MSLDDIKKAIKELEVVCKDSKDGTKLYKQGSWGFKESCRHYLTSSSDDAAIAIQPGNDEDLAKIIKIIGKHKIPFAVKGGGHSMVPGFSSTSGCQISMARFDEVDFAKDDETILEVGAGCLWDGVYMKAAEEKRGVVGGSSNAGVGVAGWLLGGGYSMKTNQFGLGIDNIAGYRVVTGDGRILTATKDENFKLYQALRGGANNFGIVTRFMLATHKQGKTYGASLLIPGSKEEEMKVAIVDYIENEKRKEAALVSAFRYRLVPGLSDPEYTISAFCVFDGEKPADPSKVPFKKFRDIVKDGWKYNPARWNTPGILNQVSVMAAMNSTSSVIGTQKENDVEGSDDYDDFGFREMELHEIQAILDYQYDERASLQPDQLTNVKDKEEEEEGGKNEGFEIMKDLGMSHTNLMAVTPKIKVNKGEDGEVKETANLGELNQRGRFGCTMVSGYTAKLVDAVAKETKEAAKYMKSRNGRLVVIDVWPFLPSIFDQSPEGAAWPHNKGEPVSPLLAYFLWEREEDDEFWLETMKKALDNIHNVAKVEGCTMEDPQHYLNTSLESVPVEWIYRGNLSKLSDIRANYDPENVMGNTGGFNIPMPDSA